ncbi:MAG: hypothetical protein IIY21_15500 [Clostridiales bacterium]|nr:hypothetical protein [Clostridiales bacterium]MBQ1570385.1 hypothetical protein [Clostridiales bacterium]
MSVDMQWNFMNPQNTMEADIAAKKARAAAQMQGYQTAPMNAAPQGYHPTMISQPSGQIAPDMEGYGKEMEAASAQLSGQMAREKKIGELESQISSLEQSIAEKTAKLQNWTGNADKIAAIEASKINSQDPTMVWRWNEGRKDAEKQAELNRIATLKREELENKNAQKKYKNTVDMLLEKRVPTEAGSQEQMLNNVESVIRDGKNIGAHDEVSRLMERKAELEQKLYGKKRLDTGMYQSGNREADITSYIDSLKIKNPSVEEIDSVLQHRDEMTLNQIKTLETMRSEAENRAKAKAKKAKDDATTASWLSE